MLKMMISYQCCALALSPNRIRVTMDESCSSYLGRKGGEQILALGDGCDLVWHLVIRTDFDFLRSMACPQCKKGSHVLL